MWRVFNKRIGHDLIQVEEHVPLCLCGLDTRRVPDFRSRLTGGIMDHHRIRYPVGLSLVQGIHLNAGSESTVSEVAAPRQRSMHMSTEAFLVVL